LDTGALYRAVAWKVKTAGVDPSSVDEIEALLSSTTLQLISHDQILSVFVDSQEVGQEIRSLAIGAFASSLAAIPVVRDWLLPIQRDFGAKGAVVAEGRDMGTRVFPYADVKFFLDADLDVRTSRRHQEIEREEKGQNWTEVRQNIGDRDARDRSRTVAPLVPASDAMVIDTSTLSVEQVVDRMLKVIAPRR
jgi:cytidylate kinase